MPRGTFSVKSNRSHKQDRLAKLYDAEILPIWSQRFGRMLLRRLAVPPKAMVLDVGAGTGYPALEVLRKMDEAGRIISIDWSSAMLDVARAKAGALGGKRIFFRSESVEPRLSFAADVFDLVVSNLALQDLDDPERAVAEFARVAKPGGRVIATFPLAGTFAEFIDLFREVLIKADRA
jgi:ubiquinone/menaquinone biosynthesis C-methylase UbiE